MPFINDMLDSNKLKNRSATQPDISEVEPLAATHSILATTTKTRLGKSRFVFEPGSVMLKLRSRIVGQDQVLADIGAMLNVLKADIADPQRPLYVAMFVGATGVGKTELVRLLAEALHGQADAFCRIDMNTLAQDHYAAAITGAPPGYVGSKEGNSLIDVEKVQGSYSRPGIVLFDEIEKAGDEVLRSLLNVLETGHLRLTSGTKSIDFRNSLIFMTSNLGARDILHYEQSFIQGWRRFLPEFLRPSAKTRSRIIQRLVDNAIEQRFDPEFVNRIDQIHLFNRIEVHWLDSLVSIELEKLNRRLVRNHWHLSLDENARAQLANYYDPRFGARSIRRAFRKELEAALADYLLAPGTTPSKICELQASVTANQLTISEKN